MAASKVRIEGLAELDAALGELGKSAGKAVLRRVGIRSLAPLIAKAKTLVPVDDGDLRDSLKVTTKLSQRQRRQHRKLVAEGKASVEMFAGASALPHAHLVEFGAHHMAAQPFMRPAWDSEKENVLNIIKTELGDEIVKTAARKARRLAKRAAK